MLYLGLGIAVCVIPLVYCLFSLVFLIVNFVWTKSNKIYEKITLDVKENVEIFNYQPAVVGYLINSQKLGKKEIFSTLFDLIARDVIKLDFKKGFVSDNIGEYTLQLNNKSNCILEEYEEMLIHWLFISDKEKLTLKDLKLKHLCPLQI